jgi:hypothetical protein
MDLADLRICRVNSTDPQLAGRNSQILRFSDSQILRFSDSQIHRFSDPKSHSGNFLIAGGSRPML